ncbi:MAG: hypothetical protein COA70_13200 [Planctomycetota bacterium]|nr:MAG: hypothetical protein COA70_13200 [Planctomycetota bacterium]
MAFQPLELANAFVSIALEHRQIVSPMKLQKLVYYANGWWMEQNEGEPLMEGGFQAWKFGPVNLSIYRAFKKYGGDPITSPCHGIVLRGGNYEYGVPCLEDDSALEFLEAIWASYGAISAEKLSHMTHVPGTAWHEVYKRNKKDIRIPRSLILKEFQGRLA